MIKHDTVILEEFRKKFSIASYTWNGNLTTGMAFARQTKRSIERFLLSSLQKVRKEERRKCNKLINKLLSEYYDRGYKHRLEGEKKQ